MMAQAFEVFQGPAPILRATPLDPVTFQPRREGDAPVVELELFYDSTPQPRESPVRLWAIPPWIVLLVGTAYAANYFGGRI